MKQGSLAKLIEKYRPQIEIAGRTPPYTDVPKVINEFYEQVDLLVEIEDEIIFYLEESLSKREWGKYYNMWLGSAISHPSPRYIPYLFKILKEPDSSYPHWKALDVLAYMPVSISEKAVPGLIQIMESYNPVWSEEVIKKFFETLLWIGDDDGVSFIMDSRYSQNEKVARIAKDFVEQYELDSE